MLLTGGCVLLIFGRLEGGLILLMVSPGLCNFEAGIRGERSVLGLRCIG